MKRRIDYGCFLEQVKSLEDKYNCNIRIQVDERRVGEEQGLTQFFIQPSIGCIEVSYMFKPCTEYPVSVAYYGGMRDYFKTFDAAFVRFVELVDCYIENAKNEIRNDLVDYWTDDYDTDVDYETQDYDYEGPMGKD